jgi:hypothetical protein
MGWRHTMIFENANSFSVSGNSRPDFGIALPEIKIVDNSASYRRIETKGGSVGHYPQRLVNFFESFLIPLYRKGRHPVRLRTHPGLPPESLTKKNAFRVAVLRPRNLDTGLFEAVI